MRNIDEKPAYPRRRRMKPEPKNYKKTLIKYVAYLAIILFAMFWLQKKGQEAIPAKKSVKVQLSQ